MQQISLKIHHLLNIYNTFYPSLHSVIAHSNIIWPSDYKDWQCRRAADEFSNPVAALYRTCNNRGESNSIHNEIWLDIFAALLVILHTLRSLCHFLEWINHSSCYLQPVCPQLCQPNYHHKSHSFRRLFRYLNFTPSKLWVFVFFLYWYETLQQFNELLLHINNPDN